MADDWKVGDLALCVRGDEETVGHLTGMRQEAPKSGSVSTIDRVRDFDGIVGLGSRDWTGFFEASRFIKITPEEADDFDLETIELMNRKTVGETVA